MTAAATVPWPMRWEGDALAIVDQTGLPERERVLVLREAEEVGEAIAAMRVRGAPAIGLAGAYGAALAALRARERGAAIGPAVESAAARLVAARPTAVNLGTAVRQLAALAAAGADADALVGAAERLHAEDLERSRRLIEHGVTLLPPSGRHLTHCHTGALATGGLGTALGVLLEGHRRGLVHHVLVDETRPRLQGARLTALELGRAGVPFTVVADAAAASLLAAGEADQVWVGADRVARNGDVVNKIGTYALALACSAHGVPLHVAFPWTSYDPDLACGADCPIEERPAAEVLELGGRRVAASTAGARNPGFDVTPAPRVAAWVTDRGVARRPEALGGSTP